MRCDEVLCHRVHHMGTDGRREQIELGGRAGKSTSCQCRLECERTLVKEKFRESLRSFYPRPERDEEGIWNAFESLVHKGLHPAAADAEMILDQHRIDVSVQ